MNDALVSQISAQSSNAEMWAAVACSPPISKQRLVVSAHEAAQSWQASMHFDIAADMDP